MIAGIDWVVEQKTSGAIDFAVANMSLGTSDDLEPCEQTTDALHLAVCGLVSSGVPLALAAGNSSDVKQAYPEALAVSAIADFDGKAGGVAMATCRDDEDDTLANFSDYGPEVDIAAPGVCILSTSSTGGYALGSGTSMAAPHVAGAVALYLHAKGLAPVADGAGVDDIEQAILGAALSQDDPCGYTNEHAGEGSLEPLLFVNATTFGGDGTCDVATTEPLTDVAITAVSAPSPVVQGDIVSVDVTVKNVGNQDVTADITVTLTDTPPADGTAGTVTDSPQTIVGGLAAGASTTLTFSWDTSSASLGDHTLTASHDFSDDDATNNSKSTVVTVELAVTDIAITAVDAPTSVVQGAVVDVSVTVENVGNQDVTTDINVTLTDNTDGVTIGTQTISGGLPAGASTTLTFSWDTSSASLGDHTLTASHDFADGDATNDSKSTTVTVTEPGATMHVGDLDGSKDIKGKSGRWEVFVTVTIHDENHNPVANAAVTGEWSGATTGTVSSTTGSDGTVTFSTGNMSGGDSVTFIVTGVTHDTLTYDDTANHDPDEDSDGTTITVSK